MSLFLQKRINRTVRPAHGFTLIELLVVVAIIALLVSILLPTLEEARALAKRTVCMTNQRSIILGVHTYGMDYQGQIPPSNDLGYDPSYPTIAIYYHRFTQLLTLPYYHQWVFGPPGYKCTGRLYEGQYLTAADAFFCPNDTDRWGSTNRTLEVRQTDLIKGEGQAETAYSYRSAYYDSTKGSVSSPDANIPLTLSSAGRCILAGYVRTDPVGMLLYPQMHKDGWVVGYIDGHVIWFPDPDHLILNITMGPTFDEK